MTSRGFAVKRLVLIAVASLALLVLGGVIRLGLELRQRGHAKTTATTMSHLYTFLATFQPSDTSAASLSALAAREGCALTFRDDWGHDFVITVTPGANGRHTYTIRSLGRDARLGDCCKGEIAGQWDDDAVLSDGKWLQVW